MPVDYRTPGVYIDELSNGAKPIQAVGTSTAGFVGTAPNGNAHVHEPVSILNWMHFRRVFVDDPDGNPLGETTDLAKAVLGFFTNGGSLCFVVNIGPWSGPVPGATGSRQGVDALDLVDEISIVAAPGFTDAASYDTILTHCELRKDRVAILDGPAEFDDVTKLTQVATGAPPPPEPAGDDEDAPAPPRRAAAGQGGLMPRRSERGFGAFYVPQIEMTDPLDPATTVVAPPSGHIAGVWARTDAERGVHKAPANTPLRGATRLTRHITSAEQELLNPEGVNCIRTFTGDGILVWGARTLASDPEWKYVNVRRLFCMIEQSILRSTRWIVFQPNDNSLWKSIRRDITAFLTRVWSSGALFGTTPEQAFFVQCDDETNPPEVRDAGQVITYVGVAPVKPAEFVIFRVSQHDDGSESINEGA